MLRKFGLGVLLSAGFFAFSAYSASTTHSIDVSATVNGNCRFTDAGPTTLTLANDVGAIDPSLAVDATGTATVTFRCTTGTTQTITADSGLYFGGGSRNVREGTSSTDMPYSLTLTGAAQVGTGHGAGKDLTLTVDGTIAQTDFQNVPAGSYADTVELTFTP